VDNDTTDYGGWLEALAARAEERGEDRVNNICAKAVGRAAKRLIEVEGKLSAQALKANDMIDQLTVSNLALQSRLDALSKENERLKNLGAGMFWAGGDFDDKTAGEIVALGLDVRSILDNAIKLLKAVAWYDDEIGALAVAVQNWLERAGIDWQADSATAEEWRSVVEKHVHNYGDDGRCSCGEHALGDGPEVRGFQRGKMVPPKYPTETE
jgi:hypothetical protein